MSGHSKWAQIKRKKAVTDTRKGALFTRLGKNISIAAKKGKDPEMNAGLRTAIDAAKAANMPKDNIEKAVLKGAGELPGVSFEEALYEGYGPGGVAMIIECITDNTNRTVSFLRSQFTKFGGSLAAQGSVKYLFEQRGIIRVAAGEYGGMTQEDIELLAIDAGAEDIAAEEEGLTVQTTREDFHAVLLLLQQKGITPASAGIEWVTHTTVNPDPKKIPQLQLLTDALEENEDVHAVYTNVADV